MKAKAFFLDRDGVINIDHGYISTPDSFDFVPGVFDACRTIRKNGYEIIVVTNQSGIARGYYDETAFMSLTTWMLGEFEKKGINIKAVKYCPHHSKHGEGKYLLDCSCRKPEPGMLLEAAEQFDISLSESVMVGDKLSDIEAGRRAGISHLYKIGKGEENKENDYVTCSNLFDVVTHFFSHSNK